MSLVESELSHIVTFVESISSRSVFLVKEKYTQEQDICVGAYGIRGESSVCEEKGLCSHVLFLLPAASPQEQSASM